MENCYCKNCGVEFWFVRDYDAGDCYNCKKPLVPIERRPTKRAPDARKAAQKSRSEDEEE